MSPPVLSPWQPSPAGLTLAPGEVHLWRFPLLVDTLLPEILSAAEMARAQRLKAPEKARAFTVARTRLRQILGRALGAPPETLRFCTGEHGKPLLVGPAGGLHFNLSHSGGWGLCALSRCGALGIDLEAVDTRLDYLALAARFFSPEENAWLCAGAQARRRRNFFRLWTRKEAWLKGRGGGFSAAGLALDPAHLRGVASRGGGWSLRNLPLRRGYVAALALRGDCARILRWDWPEGPH